MKQNKILMLISSTGVIVFTLVFVISWLFTDQLERSAMAFVKVKTTEKLQLRVDKITGVNSESPTIAQRLFLAKFRDDVPKLKQDIEAVVNQLTEAKSQGQGFDSQQANMLIKGFTYSSQLWEYELIKKSFGAIFSMAKEKYTETWNALNQDIRIFSAINVLSFALVFLISFFSNPVPLPRFVSMVSWLLVFCTVVCIAIYIFGQNWFYTILFDRYYGTGYFTLLSIVFLYLFFELSVSFLTERKSVKPRRG